MHQKDYSGFVYFHPSTRGQDGKPVFIDKGLLRRFMDLVDTATEEGRRLAVQVTELKSKAAGLESASNISDGFSHRQTFGGVEVTYAVFQRSNERNRGPGVYITGIRRVNKDDSGKDHAPGLYRVDFSAGRGWEISDSPCDNISTTVGAIGAVFSGGRYSAGETGRSFGGYFTEKLSGGKLNDGFSLYYAPSYLVDSLGVWRTSEQKTNPQGAGPKQLAQLFKATLPWSSSANPEVKYEWYVFGEGAKMLSLALNEYKGLGAGPLNEHRFTFLDPKASLGIVYKNLADVGAKVSEPGFLMSRAAYAAKVHQVTVPGELVEGLQSQGASWTQADKLVQPLAAALKSFESRGPDFTFAEMVKELMSNIDAGWT
ncbi:hypothetical protein [Microbulbifer taiwanensis]|uniref:Uncharacterized protein n=1 Tax=Microbulbifer taiwanensis TaxID=986746 RepID=A0ABW1YNS2_9GAMM